MKVTSKRIFMTVLVSSVCGSIVANAKVSYEDAGINKISYLADIIKNLPESFSLAQFKADVISEIKQGLVIMNPDGAAKCRTYTGIFSQKLSGTTINVGNYNALIQVERYLRLVKGIFEEDESFSSDLANDVKSIVNEIDECLVADNYGYVTPEMPRRTSKVGKQRLKSYGINRESIFFHLAVMIKNDFSIENFVNTIRTSVTEAEVVGESSYGRCRRYLNGLNNAIYQTDFNFRMHKIYAKAERLIRLSLGMLQRNNVHPVQERIIFDLKNCLKLHFYGIRFKKRHKRPINIGV